MDLGPYVQSPKHTTPYTLKVVNNGDGTLTLRVSADFVTSAGVAGGFVADNGDGVPGSAIIDTLKVMARNTLWDGANGQHDLARIIINSLNTAGFGIQAVGLVANFDDVAPGAVSENNFGPTRMSANRVPYAMLRDGAGNERGANVDASGNLSVAAKNQPATTAALSNVAASASSVTLQASNGNRRGLIVYNDSTAVLYLKFGATASATSFTVQVGPGATYEFPQPVYTGIVDGIWASATGNARMTELT